MGITVAFKMAIGAVVGVAIATAPAYLYGRNVGRQQAVVEALQRSVDALRERGKIDAEISAADRNALCGLVGLQPDERNECLRRLEEVDAKP